MNDGLGFAVVIGLLTLQGLGIMCLLHYAGVL